MKRGPMIMGALGVSGWATFVLCSTQTTSKRHLLRSLKRADLISPRTKSSLPSMRLALVVHHHQLI